MFNENLGYWRNKEIVIKNKSRINSDSKKVLIEIAAQHPLKDGKEPGVEFESRLLRAIELYKKEIEKGNEVVFYIPGSRHYITNKVGEKIQDLIPLAESGKRYLIAQGISEEIIRAEDSNIKYKGKEGVYNSGDECYVASKIYEDEDCDKLISVVSPVQVFRKGMFYNQFGIQPQIYSVPVENTFHNYIGEMFWSLYVTTFIDHDWQGDNSFLSVLTRIERCLDYKCSTEEENTLKNKRIVIPSDILKIKQELLEKYNNAKENMESKKENSEILVELVLSETNYGLEIDNTIELCRSQIEKGRNVIVTIDSRESAMRFYSELYKQNIEGIQIKITGEPEKEFDQNKYGSYFCVCPSDKVFKKSITAIKNGVLPMIYTVPSEKDDYISETFELFDSIIGKDIIDKSDEPGVESIDREEIVKGLMSQIDPESLEDLPEEVIQWINSYTEGEEVFYEEER